VDRIADYACDIAELSELLPEGDRSPEILHMGKHLLSMYNYVLSVLREEQEMIIDLNDEDDRLGAEPFLAIVVGLVLTTMIQSSTAVFAIMMSRVSSSWGCLR